jgi:hypothetical protein
VPICETHVLDLLARDHLSASLLYACSSLNSFRYVLQWLAGDSTRANPLDDDDDDDNKRFIERFLPDLITSYRNNEHELTAFFSAQSPDVTYRCATVVMQYVASSPLPCRSSSTRRTTTEFDRIESNWLRLNLWNSIDEPFNDDNDMSAESHTTSNTCPLNVDAFKRVVDLYENNVRFIQQLKDRHAVRLESMCSKTMSRRVSLFVCRVSGRTSYFIGRLSAFTCSTSVSCTSFVRRWTTNKYAD